MKSSPGSFLWLVGHDVRLNWRRFADMLGGLGAIGLMGLFIGGGIVLHLVAWPAVLWLDPLVHREGARFLPVAAAVF